MAHGFSGVREQRLDAYAERFAASGIAVLLFDYRHFGASEGEPRQLVSIRSQLEDWEAAIRTARETPGIDAARIALFGTSFSGGHVQTLASRDARIAAVVAQVPLCDGVRNLPALGLMHALRLTLAGLRDRIHALLGMEPYKVPAIGAPGSDAVMTTPGIVDDFAALDPPGSTWRNEVCARVMLEFGGYRPGREASKIRCPILYTIAERDGLTLASLAHEAAARAPHAEVAAYDCDHFEVYVEPMWDRVVAAQEAFFTRTLFPGRTLPRTG